jgi:dienelactone hydrolase
MREDIEFDAEGATLRGWFYRPDDAGGEVPCIVMAHGFSAIKEMHLDAYADVFCDAGLACVVFDNRGFGASDAAPGRPRLEIDPWEQVRDYQHAITYAQLRPEVDARRIGVWGLVVLGRALLRRRRDRPPREGGVRPGSADLGPPRVRDARAH